MLCGCTRVTDYYSARSWRLSVVGLSGRLGEVRQWLAFLSRLLPGPESVVGWIGKTRRELSRALLSGVADEENRYRHISVGCWDANGQ
jgi:hypothetical protein